MKLDIFSIFLLKIIFLFFAFHFSFSEGDVNNNFSSTPYLDLRGIEYESKQEYHATAPQTARSISTVHGTPRSYGMNGFRNDRTDIQNKCEQIPYLKDFVGKVSSLDSDSSIISSNNNNNNIDNNNIDNNNNDNKHFQKNKSSPEKKTKKSPNEEKKKNEANFDDFNNYMNDTVGIKNRPDSPLLLPLSSAMIKNPIRERNDDDDRNKSDINNNSSDINIRSNSSHNQVYNDMKSEYSMRSPSKNVLTTSKYKDTSVADDNKVQSKGKDNDRDATIESDFQKHCSFRSKSQFTSKDVENEIQYGSISDFDVDTLLRKNMYVHRNKIFL